ncbi:MAG TPA: leucyl aminopeptidase family protein [Stellaceae bacterium]|nr:leucyl aminopeptidase family protein [Stellaceae bacterium]
MAETLAEVKTLADAAPGEGIPITAITKERFASWSNSQPEPVAAWLRNIGFSGEAGKTALLPGVGGSLAGVVQGVAVTEPLWSLAGLPDTLPEGLYRIEGSLDGLFGAGGATHAALGWALGSYAFTRYKSRGRGFAKLAWPDEADRPEVEHLAAGVALARDLINTPAEDMGPAELAAAAEALADRHDAEISLIVGEDLIAQNYAMIHAVGRGSSRAPRLIDLRWGDPTHPKVTLVGKGVCFDSGGLDLKTAGGMKLMKKDMGGAATLLGLAHAVMSAGLKVRLRVLIPAVENSVSSTSFRPLDVIRTRKGLTVEVGNTDAEGRLVLCDALAEADTEAPSLLVDFATLTGAARVALGPDLPALFANDDRLAAEYLAASEAEADPVWRLPLWRPYRRMLDSKVADLNNVSDSGFAGAIVAAVYLQEFVSEATPWLHLDTIAWNPTGKPGRPEGGEALGLRGLFRLLKIRYG